MGQRNRLRHEQEAADVITNLKELPESTFEPRFGLDLERQTVSFQNVFMRYVFHVFASHPVPVMQLLDQPRRPLHLTLPERLGGFLSWYDRGIVAEPSHCGFCFAVVPSTQVALLGGHAMNVVEGFVARVLRFLVVAFGLLEKLRDRPPAIVI